MWPSDVMVAATVLLTLASRSMAFVEVLTTGRQYPDRSAEFGPSLPAAGLTAMLIPIEFLAEESDSEDAEMAQFRDTLEEDEEDAIGNRRPQRALYYGCEPLKRRPRFTTSHGSDETVPWIALVQRGGGCNFVDKVRAMQQSGAAAVIVGDGAAGSGGLVRMIGRDESETADIYIPAAFIEHWAYRDLKYQAVERSAGTKAPSLGDVAAIPHLAVKLHREGFYDWGLFDVMAVAVFGPLLLIVALFFVWQCKYGADDFFLDEPGEFAGAYDPLRLVSGTNSKDKPASVEAVNRLPCGAFCAQSRGLNDLDLCVICLDAFEEGDRLRRLPCKHEFHVGCIDPWLLTRKRYCPVCRGDACPDVDADVEAACGDAEVVELGVTEDSNRNSTGGAVTDANTNGSSESAPLLRPTPPATSGMWRSLFRGSTASLRSTASSVGTLNIPGSDASNLTPRSLPPIPVANLEDYEGARQLALNLRNGHSRRGPI
jgi:hypothetical protein